MLLAAGLVACAAQADRPADRRSGGQGGGGDSTAGIVVDLPRSYMFRPETVTVAAGSAVTWTNHDAFTHAVAFDDGGTVNLTMRPGDDARYVFARPGDYAYDCPFHPQMMNGVVRVRR